MDFKFKSSGKSYGEVLDVDLIPKQDVELKYGFQTPIRLGDEIFKQYTDIGSYIKDNLRNLLMTNPGERIGRGSTLGINFDDALYGPLDEKTQNQIMSQIRQQTSKYLPFVTLRTIEFIDAFTHGVTNPDNRDLNSLQIVVHYDVPAAKIQDDSVQAEIRNTFSPQTVGS